ncbi:MATE family efflux transporter [Francisella adeliensis]|uniref:Multidrug-efflux transporter n=1 Tax=Francisella adeliensis TaxID=2007306 RepID=A0A2Z4XW38_9GAMM|nr:MATE family efflux transporter [Francisella adeliensis]AXA33061.1 MATE family efflux transporter [Francisella adeliensis]MBK2086051.1 MATE family efflux transporter [Francisella adeliensis]MBK2096785.1 MATE family efflux transporter [Francisella adeliensis]QIW11288.1 MATE family efflux transporter [Francisella adeliensis]QIW13164.1 MATE family efflux transporter [Francisella adeliensis]
MSILLNRKSIEQSAEMVTESFQEENQAIFTKGSVTRHVIIMSLTSSIGLIAIFIVDLLDMFFLSILGEVELASAVGYAGTISFFTTSIGIGISIAMGALISRSVGEGKKNQANCYLINIYLIALIITVPIAIIVWLYIPDLLMLIGAKERTLELATQYLKILIPSFPILVLGIASGAALRAFGDAKFSMYSTLAGGLVNAILDPIFIFLLAMNVEGAAVASVFARVTILLVAFFALVIKYKVSLVFYWKGFKDSLYPILKVAFPAILTNMTTPIGTAYTIAEMSKFGDSAVAGMSVIGRLSPVAFAIVFAVSGAIGSIIGQNLGAKNINRVKKTLTSSLWFVCIVVLIVSIVLMSINGYLVYMFQLDSEAAQLMYVFSHFIAISYIFVGAGFIANAAFNNLGKPLYSFVVNMLKATVFTMPFVYFGGQNYGAEGILVGQGIGSLIIGLVAYIFAHRYVYTLKK